MISKRRDRSLAHWFANSVLTTVLPPIITSAAQYFTAGCQRLEICASVLEGWLIGEPADMVVACKVAMRAATSG